MKHLLFIIAAALIVSAGVSAQDMAFQGKWIFTKDGSADYDFFRNVTAQITMKPGEITIHKVYGPKRPTTETVTLKTDGSKNNITVKDRGFLANFFMGLKLAPGGKKEVRAAWIKPNVLSIDEKYDVMTSQGTEHLDVHSTYELSADNNLLTYTIARNSRKSGPPMKYLFKRMDSNNSSYVYQMNDDWEIRSGLPTQACFISLQGIVNETKPTLYFLYGPKFTFNYTGELFTYLEKQRHMYFTRLGSLEQALQIFKSQIKGYIVWDKNVRTSLIVSYTLAGLEKGIVITEDMIPMVEKLGLKQIEDFRGKFTGKSDYEIYTWAYQQYWQRCSRDFIIWLGGEHGTVMIPGVADFGMVKKVFFTDLSARETDTLEYGLTRKMLSEMKPLGQVMGWHSYKKDMEEEWVTVTSSFGLAVEGLHNLPNTSFLYRVPPTPGFKYKNHHNVEPGKTYTPGNKVYVALVQTDGLGLGAWVKPGRGSIPYAWETSMKFSYLSPAMMEWFYSQATPNDLFIGALSGSSYMYPKAFPKNLLGKELAKAQALMDTLDINVFEIMDYSAEKMDGGNNELTKEIVDAYYKAMPDVLGFLNGYHASFTFAVKDKRPFISYDYYLSAEKSEEEAAADLEELATLNGVRPYFLLVHVREYSDVARVKSICDKLGSEFQVVPLDLFLKLAGEKPTFKENYMDSNKD
jgi:hypothetical protein